LKPTTIFLAVAVTLGLTVACLFPLASGAHPDVSVAAFGVAGAIVALVLPASSLTHDAAQKVVDTYIDRTAKAPRESDPASDVSLTAGQWATAGLEQVGALRTRAAAARLASGFVYAGFLLSMLSLLQVADPVVIHFGQNPVRPWQVAASAALACLAVGGVMFLPLAWWLWTPRLLESSEATLRYFARPVVKEPTQVLKEPTQVPPEPGSPSGSAEQSGGQGPRAETSQDE